MQTGAVAVKDQAHSDAPVPGAPSLSAVASHAQNQIIYAGGESGGSKESSSPNRRDFKKLEIERLGAVRRLRAVHKECSKHELLPYSSAYSNQVLPYKCYSRSSFSRTSAVVPPASPVQVPLSLQLLPYKCRSATFLSGAFAFFISICYLMTDNLDDGSNPETSVVDDVPGLVATWVKTIRDTLKKNSTTNKVVSELDPLVWGSLEQTLEQLVTLKTGSSQAFVRDLDPELFHWHGTRVTFMSLQLLKGFWKKKEEKVRTPSVGGKHSTKSFMAYQLLDQLSDAAALLYPFTITRKGIIHDAVLEDMSWGLVKQQSFLGISDKLAKSRGNAYAKAKTLYACIAADRAAIVVKSMQPRAFENVSFSPLTSWVPSGDYLRSVYLSSQETCLPGASHSKVDYQRLRMSMVAGEYLCIDDNFQLPKYIRDSDGTPLFTAMTTVMNEYNEVCARYLKPDQSYKTVMVALGLVAKRYDKEGVKPLKYMTCDNVIAQQRALREAFKPLLDDKDAFIEDLLHVSMRYTDVLPDKHPLKVAIFLVQEVFIDKISAALYDLHHPDVEKVKAHLHVARDMSWVDIKSKWDEDASYWRSNPSIRKSVPGPQQLRTRLDGAIMWLLNHDIDATIKSEMSRVHQNQLKLVDMGLFSDPCDVEGMYVTVNQRAIDAAGEAGTVAPLPIYKTWRSSCQLKSSHRLSNMLLKGSCKGAQLSGIFISQHDFQNNVKAGIVNRGDVDYGTYCHERLQHLKDYLLGTMGLADLMARELGINCDEQVTLPSSPTEQVSSTIGHGPQPEYGTQPPHGIQAVHEPGFQQPMPSAAMPCGVVLQHGHQQPMPSAAMPCGVVLQHGHQQPMPSAAMPCGVVLQHGHQQPMPSAAMPCGVVLQHGHQQPMPSAAMPCGVVLQHGHQQPMPSAAMPCGVVLQHGHQQPMPSAAMP
eukprot:gene8883-3765_t